MEGEIAVASNEELLGLRPKENRFPRRQRGVPRAEAFSVGLRRFQPGGFRARIAWKSSAAGYKSFFLSFASGELWGSLRCQIRPRFVRKPPSLEGLRVLQHLVAALPIAFSSI